MRRIASLLVLFALLWVPAAAFAQTGDVAPRPNLGASKIDPAGALDDLLSVLEQQMMPAVRAMPPEKYNFAPSAALFMQGQPTKFEGVRTFAAEATHVAEANYYFFSQLSDLKPDMDPGTIEKLTNKDDIVMALHKSFAYGHRVIASITPANAWEEIKPVDGLRSRATIAAFATAHGFDHYGQMVEYLRMNGIVPPASAK